VSYNLFPLFNPFSYCTFVNCVTFYLFLKMLCTDTTEHDTMFRIVVKSNLTMYLAEDLVKKLDEVVPLLDKLKGEVKSLKRESQRKRRSSYIHVC